MGSVRKTVKTSKIDKVMDWVNVELLKYASNSINHDILT
jgi:hypothetical protein